MAKRFATMARTINIVALGAVPTATGRRPQGVAQAAP